MHTNVCSAPALVNSSIWKVVVTGEYMLLNTKSLIATKQLVFFVAPKSIKNLLHQMFF